MDAKFSAGFWTDRNVVELDKDAKLAAAWMISNSGVNLAGYAEVSEKVFRFETEVDMGAMDRALTGLKHGFVRVGLGYWMRNFIRDQLGMGDSLQRNAMCGPLLRDMRAMPAEVVSLVLEQYPELEGKWDKLLSESSNTPPPQPPRGGLASPAGAPGTRKSRVERRGAEQSRTEQNGAQGGAGGKRAVTPAELGEPLASRLITLGLLKARQATEAWSPAEIAAVRDARLDALSEEDFQAQMAPMRTYYFATIPRGTDRRRKDLGGLLANWLGELDRAREHVRATADGVKRH